MSAATFHARRVAGLGLLAGAILHEPLSAQQPQRDTTRADTMVVEIPRTPAESLLIDTVQRTPPLRVVDTLKAPIALSDAPRTYAIGATYRWTREELFASGALTLLDLLERVPGVTGLRSGWLPAPQVAAYLGEPSRVRILYDGLELDPLDARTGGILDLADIPIWTLEELVVERGASELRVHLRSWTYRRTEPLTRTDVLTGDEETNLFRGFYAKRFRHGEALQLAAEQYGSTAQRFTGVTGDQLALLGRVGWASGRWSTDAFALRSRRTRQRQLDLSATPVIPALDATTTIAYLRGSYGDPHSGLWAQVIAGHQRFRESSPQVLTGGDAAVPAEVADTSRSTAEYVAALGYSRGALRMSVTSRTSAFGGESRTSQIARASLELPWLALSTYAEHAGRDSTSRVEASIRLLPLPFVEGMASVAQVYDNRPAAPRRTSHFARAELGVRAGGLWLGAGALFRDSAQVTAPLVFSPSLVAVTEDRAAGAFLVLRGRVWRSIFADATALRWNAPGFYRPQFQTRSQLSLSTSWLSRFPSGHFGIVAAGVHEYRSTTPFPMADGIATAPQSRVLSTLLEIRIVNAVLSWQLRNALGVQYQVVPGLDMPRNTNLYGVRWEFWN